MKIRVVKVFGREVLRIESHYEATVSDVVRAMIRLREGDGEEICTCEDDEDEIDERFSDLTERIVWDARTEDYPMPGSLFDKPDEDETS